MSANHRTLDDFEAKKSHATLAARFALVGAELTVESRLDGSTRYLVALRSRVHQFDTLGQAEILADVIEGAQ